MFPEELLCAKGFSDMKAEGFLNWSSLIPVKAIKEKLRPRDNSYLKTGTSSFTFVRKTRAEAIGPDVYDINLMPPLIVRNCLPTPMTLRFVDSSGVK